MNPPDPDPEPDPEPGDGTITLGTSYSPLFTPGVSVSCYRDIFVDEQNITPGSDQFNGRYPLFVVYQNTLYFGFYNATTIWIVKDASDGFYKITSASTVEEGTSMGMSAACTTSPVNQLLISDLLDGGIELGQ